MPDREERAAQIDELSRIEDRKDLETIFRLASLLHTFTDSHSLLENLVNLTIEHLNAERGVIFLKDKAGVLYPTAAKSLYPDDLVDAQKIARSVVEEAMSKKDGLVTPNAQTDPRFHSESAIHYNILSVICVPLEHRDRILGAIYLDHGKKSGAFSERDNLFLKAFVKLSVSVIHHLLEMEAVESQKVYLSDYASGDVSYPEIITNSP